LKFKQFQSSDSNLYIADYELIERYKTSLDKHWLGLLFCRYTEMLYGLGLKYFKNEEEACDMVQEIFMTLSLKLSNHEVENFKPWLYRLASNFCIDKLRKNTIKNTELTIKHYQLEEVQFDLIDEWEEKELILKKIKECLMTLEVNQRKCIDLFFFQEKSYQEVANDLDISWGKTRSLIQNGKRNLKICMERK
jgi:RNA polymerase sigma-70 factor (ECF subfamily)